MDNIEVKELIVQFKAYRDLLLPVQKNLNDFTDTYDIMRENIDKLNTAFEGDVKGKMEELFRQMSTQASKTASLSERIDKLTEMTQNFATETQKLMGSFSTLEKAVMTINSLEQRAEEQIAKLDEAVSYKTKNYNVKELERSLETYNQDVRKVSEFINKNVGESLQGTQKQVDAMKTGLDGIVRMQNQDSETLKTLLENYKVSNDFLRKITESKDVNEAYLFDILDKWAESRRLKIKN